MALIKCPECGKENVSDSAQSCPSCGFGIKDYYSKERASEHKDTTRENRDVLAIEKANNEKNKRLDNVKMPEKPSKGRYIFAGIVCAFMALVGWFGVVEELGFIWLVIAVIFTLLAVFSPIAYKDEQQKYRQSVENPQEYRERVIAEEDRKRAEAIRQARLESMNASISPRCPKCGSPYISTVNRGYSIVWGFIGSGTAMNVCQKCGHKWKPRG